MLPALPDPLPDPSDPAYAAVLEQERAVQIAVDILWGLSGRQFGVQQSRVRPCREDGFRERHATTDYGVTSYTLSWEGDLGWMNVSCGCWGGSCRLSGPRAVHLVGSPISGIIEVEVNGATLDPSEYTLEDDVLYRVGKAWPRQDLGRPLGEINTWAVTYQFGLPVPPAAVKLTGVLAKEFLSAFVTDSKCRLPRNVAASSRNGVSYREYDPQVIYANGKTGIPEIDMWLATVNPYHLMEAPSVI